MKKNLRIRDITVGDTYSVGETIEILRNFDTDEPIVAKFGNKNFCICGDKEISKKPVLILK